MTYPPGSGGYKPEEPPGQQIYPPPEESQPQYPPSADPYAQYGQGGQSGPYVQPGSYGQPDQYGQPAAPYGQPADPYSQPGAAYGQPADPYAQQYGYPQAGAYPQQPYGYAPQGGNNGLAIAAMICGLLGCFTCISAVVGIVLGFMALNQLKQNPYQTGRGMALTGIISGFVAIAGYLIYIVVLIGFALAGS